MGDNKLVTRTEPRTFHFDLPTDTDINLKHKIYSIMKRELLAEHTTKNMIRQLVYKYKHGNYIHEHGKWQNGRTT